MENYVVKKLYRKMKKASVKANVLFDVIRILETHEPECARDQIDKMYNLQINKETYFERQLGIDREEREIENSSGEYDFRELNRKRITDFTPTKEEFLTTIGLPIGELQKMGCSRIVKAGILPPEGQVYLALPYEWVGSIPEGTSLIDWTGNEQEWSSEDIRALPIIMGCLPVGILREPDGTEYIPTFQAESPKEDKDAGEPKE